MPNFVRLAVFIAAGGVAAFCGPKQSWATEIVTISQIGSNVVADGAGSINTAGLTFVGYTSLDPWIDPSNPAIIFGPANGTWLLYNKATGPANFGSGGLNIASTSTGQFFGMEWGSQQIALPSGYVSGSFLIGEDIWDNKTLAALGLTLGTYTYSWGSGATADSLVIEVGAVAPVPEPTSLALLGLGLAGLSFCRRLRYSVGAARHRRL